MKIWVESCSLKGYLTDGDVKFGIGWYRHSKNHKWFGFTVHFYLLYWLISVNFVNNYKEYDKRINSYTHKKKDKK